MDWPVAALCRRPESPLAGQVERGTPGHRYATSYPLLGTADIADAKWNQDVAVPRCPGMTGHHWGLGSPPAGKSFLAEGTVSALLGNRLGSMMETFDRSVEPGESGSVDDSGEVDSLTAVGDGPADPFPNLLNLPEGALYSPRYPMALAYAAVMHSDQKRKDNLGTPYIVHPMAVSALVWHYGLAVAGLDQEIEDLALGALLHDVAEDAGGQVRIAEIEQMFGQRVAELVTAATDSLATDPAEKAKWRPRKEEHISRVRELSSVGPDGYMVDPGACLVIACDKLHNLTGTAAAVSATGDSYLLRFNGGVDGTRWYYRTMFDALKPGLPDTLIHDYAAQLARLGG